MVVREPALPHQARIGSKSNAMYTLRCVEFCARAPVPGANRRLTYSSELGLMMLMKKSLGVAFFILLLAKNLAYAENPLPLPEAHVLPLALCDDFQFRKFDIFINAELRPSSTPIPTRHPIISLHP